MAHSRDAVGFYCFWGGHWEGRFGPLRTPVDTGLRHRKGVRRRERGQDFSTLNQIFDRDRYDEEAEPGCYQETTLTWNVIYDIVQRTTKSENWVQNHLKSFQSNANLSIKKFKYPECIIWINNCPMDGTVQSVFHTCREAVQGWNNGSHLYLMK